MSCPCGSRKSYEKCCGQIHEGKLPETCEELMRSRYTAYKKKLVDYLLDTTDPHGPMYPHNIGRWRKDVEQFCQYTSFDKLEVHHAMQEGDEGEVFFTAHLTQNGEDASFTERSAFVNKGGRWFYHHGEVH